MSLGGGNGGGIGRPTDDCFGGTRRTGRLRTAGGGNVDTGIGQTGRVGNGEADATPPPDLVKPPLVQST